jgi:hypothetical protein
MRREANRLFQCLPGMALLACLAVLPGFAIQSSTQPDQLTSASPAKPVIDANGTYHAGNGVTPPILVYSVDTEFQRCRPAQEDRRHGSRRAKGRGEWAAR